MFHVNDRVCHIKDLELVGTIVQIDPYEILGEPSDVTTCRVVWDGTEGDPPMEDIQWTNKLVLLP